MLDPLATARGIDLWSACEARLAGGGSVNGAILARLCNSSQRRSGTPRESHDARVAHLRATYPLTWQRCCEHSPRTGTTCRAKG